MAASSYVSVNVEIILKVNNIVNIAAARRTTDSATDAQKG
jgi:hypothetical protein